MRISDWSSDVCSSDLCEAGDAAWPLAPVRRTSGQADAQGAGTDCGHAASVQGRAGAGFQKPELTRSDGSEDRKSVVWGKSVSVRADSGGRRIITKRNAEKMQMRTN